MQFDQYLHHNVTKFLAVGIDKCILNKVIRDGKYLARHMPVLGNFHPIKIEFFSLLHFSARSSFYILIGRATQEVPMKNI